MGQCTRVTKQEEVSPEMLKKLMVRNKKKCDRILNQNMDQAKEMFIGTLIARSIGDCAIQDHDEQLEIVLKAQKKMMNRLLDADRFTKDYIPNYLDIYTDPRRDEDRDRKVEQRDAKSGWFYIGDGRKEQPFSDFENDQINEIMDRHKSNVPDQDRYVEDGDKIIDLKMQTVRFRDRREGEDFQMFKAQYKRRSGEASKWSDQSSLMLRDNMDTNTEEKQEFDIKDYQGLQKKDFGQTWFKEISKKRVPSLKEIIEGLTAYYTENMISTKKDLTEDEAKRMQKGIENMTKKLYNNVSENKLTDEQFNDPLKNLQSDINPAAKVILYIYTIEPPFYSHVNNACRWFQEDKLQRLGPYSYALGMITWGAQSNKFGKDVRQFNEKTDQRLGCFEKHFNVYRGARMKREWIQDWERQVGLLSRKDLKRYPVRLPGFTSTSEDIQVAMQFSAPKAGDDDTWHSVLFILTVRNTDEEQGYGFKGYDMGTVTAYPEEKEILLSESIPIYVMAVRHVISKLYGNDYFIIHLLNI